MAETVQETARETVRASGLVVVMQERAGFMRLDPGSGLTSHQLRELARLWPREHYRYRPLAPRAPAGAAASHSRTEWEDHWFRSPRRELTLPEFLLALAEQAGMRFRALLPPGPPLAMRARTENLPWGCVEEAFRDVERLPVEDLEALVALSLLRDVD